MAEMRFWNRAIVKFAAVGVIAAVFLILGYLSYFRPVTTVILVRHAEKVVDPSNPDVPLSKEGEARAQELARMLTDSGISAVYASQYVRTQMTVKPTADRLSIPITKVEAANVREVARQIKSKHTGGVVFLAGHNNTVPAIISALGGGTFPIIPENEYDNIFVVTIPGFGKTRVMRLKFGSHLTAAGQQMMVQP